MTNDEKNKRIVELELQAEKMNEAILKTINWFQSINYKPDFLVEIAKSWKEFKEKK